MPSVDPDDLYVRPRSVTCPTCKGKKIVRGHLPTCTESCRMEVHPCPTCNGKGTVLR